MAVAPEQGVLPDPGRQLFSNQGDVLVSTDEGVVYTLRFGGSVFGTGEELTAGAPDDAEKKADEKAGAAKDKDKEKAKKAEGTTENRFVRVTAPSTRRLIAKPKPDDSKPKDVATAKPGEPLEIPAHTVRARPQGSQVHRRAEGSQGEGRARAEGLREEDRRRQEEGPGAYRPVRRLVLRDAGRQLPLDQPRPRRPRQAQESRLGHSARRGTAYRSPAAARRCPARSRRSSRERVRPVSEMLVVKISSACASGLWRNPLRFPFRLVNERVFFTSLTRK